MTRFTPALLSIALAIASSIPGLADDYQPRNTQAPGEEPPSPAEAAAAITVPEGFKVTLFAGEPDVRQPVAMAIDDRGRLWVAESYSYKEWQGKGEDRILIFEDSDNDGVHDTRKVFWTGAKHLSGMTVGWGGVWLCDSPNLTFIPDRDRDDVPDGEPEVVLDGWTTKGKHNFFNGLTWGIDGWLYGRHGITAPSKVGVPRTPDEERVEFDCSIWRYHPVTKAFEVVCRGTTNPWGLDWNAAGDLFFTNNVNGHLWHAIPGAHYPRMGNRADRFSKFVYDRIGMCCDHLHHAGGTDDWTKTRDGKGVHGELGGGHSHCGGMIYLGGKWPEKYHDRMFMCNTHGRRVNVDRLDPEGPSYVARHEDDFLHANNPWFRGVQLLYGPDGDVYLSDWTDLGECHDNDGVHRTSGRIYKIIYGEPSPPMQKPLWEMTHEDLFALHENENEWYVRTARRIILEKIASGELTDKILLSAFSERMKDLPERVESTETFEEKKLLMDAGTRLGEQFMRTYLARVPLAKPPHAISLEEWRMVNLEFFDIENLAEQDRPRQLRRLASSEFHVSDEDDWKVAQALLKAPRTGESSTLQLLTYYKIKDLAAGDPSKSLTLLRAAEDTCPIFTKNLSQNLAENGVFDPLITMLNDSGSESITEAILTGFAAGIEGRRDLDMPAQWPTAFSSAFNRPEMRTLALKIHLAFDETDSRHRIVALLGGENSEDKALALDLLANLKVAGVENFIVALVADPDLAPAAIPLLARYGRLEHADLLIAQFPILDAEAQAICITTLCENKKFADRLIAALESGTIPRHAVTAYHARQIHSLKDDELKKRIAAAWGRMGSTSAEKQQQIKDWQNQLTPDVLAKADLEKGHTTFQQLCSACHMLNGEGNAVGPELTGANRSDVFYLLENIIAPSATLPQDFRMAIITQKDDAVLTGNVTSQNEYTVTLRTLTETLTINRKDITKLETTDVSMMPEGLLTPLDADGVRDLIAYLKGA